MASVLVRERFCRADGSVEERAFAEADYDKHLVMSVYSQLSVNEMRLFMLAVARVRANGRRGAWREVNVAASELVGYFGGNKGYYRELSRVCQRLSQKHIAIHGELHQVFSYIRFSGDDGGLYFRFNLVVLPELLRDYCEASLGEVFRLKSVYAIRLMRFLHHYIDSPQLVGSSLVVVQLDLEDLKKYLGVPDTSTYRQITNLINKIIYPSLKAIEENTPHRIECQAVREGRRVTGFAFTIRPGAVGAMGVKV